MSCTQTNTSDLNPSLPEVDVELFLFLLFFFSFSFFLFWHIPLLRFEPSSPLIMVTSSPSSSKNVSTMLFGRRGRRGEAQGLDTLELAFF